MAFVFAVAGALLILVTLWESFETMVLPRYVARRVRFTSLFYSFSWRMFRSLAKRSPHRESLAASYGPLSLLVLIGIWAFAFILGFGLLQAAAEGQDLSEMAYLSGTTFFTLGLGDVKPKTDLGRFLVVVESGLGFAILAIVIGYLPMLQQSFARREVEVSLAATYTGSTPTALDVIEMPLRHNDISGLLRMLQRWEVWFAELHQTYISYPMVAFYRSQHEHTSWLTSMVVMLDVCTLLRMPMNQEPEGFAQIRDQAEMTAAMGIRTLKALSMTLKLQPEGSLEDRLRTLGLSRLSGRFAHHGLSLAVDPLALTILMNLRGAYEPYAYTLADYLLLSMPEFIAAEEETSPTTAEQSILSE